jgi:sulfite oxidase
VIGADGEVAKTMTVQDLKDQFPKHSITVTMQCAGNRRSEMHAARDVKGLQWTSGSVSTAVWSGARLADVLKTVGVKPGPDAQHVQLVGLDCDMSGVLYCLRLPSSSSCATL